MGRIFTCFCLTLIHTDQESTGAPSFAPFAKGGMENFPQPAVAVALAFAFALRRHPGAQLRTPVFCLCLTLIHTGHESAGAPSFAPLRRLGCKISLSQQLLLPLFSRHLERSEGPPHFALVPALAE